jgi:hypothetical protein
VSLVAPAVAHASNGNGNGNDPAPAADVQTTTDTTSTSPAPTSGDQAPTTATTAAAPTSAPASEAAATQPASSTTPSVAPDPAPPVQTGGGNGNGNGNANGPDPSQTNATTTSGNQTQPNGSSNGNPNASGAPTNNGNSDHTGNANANANSSQDKPKNVNVNARVGQPGNNGAVVQSNESSAAAAAGASGGSGGSGAPQQATANGADDSAGAAAANGGSPPAPSQADSTAGETEPVANSPPTSADGDASSSQTAPTSDYSPTVSNTPPSASSVNGAAGAGTNGASQAEATPVTTASEPTSVDNASAGATSTQVQPTNVNASVRVLSPGGNGQVGQTNDSSAAAAAGATGPTDGQATELAQATSTQADPTNVNVSVRVGSPGDDGAVSQANTATARAGPVDPNLIDSVDAELPQEGPNTSADVQNVSDVTQALSQCTEDTACEPSAVSGGGTDTPSGTTAADQSVASATQQGATNLSVSIRVASSGLDGAVDQSNEALAQAASAVTTSTDPQNVVVAVVIPGDPSQVAVSADPNQPWNWIWDWTDGAAPSGSDAAPTASPDWNWSWGDQQTAQPPAATPGHWTWTWVWTRGDGTTFTWTYDQLCNCTWNWVWTWTWPADSPSTPPAVTAPAVGAPPAEPQVSQTNTSSAAAAALTTFDGQQTTVSSTDGDPSGTTANQEIASSQEAVATAAAAQVRPLNVSLVTAGELDGLTQLNAVAAGASAGVFDTASQSITQNQSGTDDGAAHTVDAAQTISTTQTASAHADSVQADVVNATHVWSQSIGNHARIGSINQKNRAVTAAYAAVASETTQTIDQSQTGGRADQLAAAIQAAIVNQAHVAAVNNSELADSNRALIEIPWNGLWNPSVDQSHSVSSVAVSTAYSGITQTIVQEESGDGVGWDEHALQVAVVDQSGLAAGHAEASYRDNLALWNGAVAAPPSASSGSVTPLSGIAGGRRLIAPIRIFGPPSSFPGSVWVGGSEFVFAVRSGTLLHVSAGGTVQAAATSATPSSPHGSTSPGHSNPYRHALLNLLGVLSSALVLFLGATPVAALLAPFMIAALAVGRLQYLAPALGRSADFARRERPG